MPNIVNDLGGGPPDPFQFLGLATPAPPPPVAVATLGVAPTVSKTPTPGQGLALDTNGRIPVSVAEVTAGFEIAYTEFQNLVSVTATTIGTANTVVTAAQVLPGGATSTSIPFDGKTTIKVEFGCAYFIVGTSSIAMFLFEDALPIGRLAFVQPTAGIVPGPPVRRFTPTAGQHTYSIRATVDGGTGSIAGGSGGATITSDYPGYIRISRV